MPDSGQDALSLTLPKVGSRTRGKRKKLPKPPKRELLWVLINAFSGIANALMGHWIAFAFCMFLLVTCWSEMLFAMNLRRLPWWKRGPVEGITMVALVLGGFALTIFSGG